MSHNNLFIPPYLIEEILLNLDAQTLIRCAFLCRDWNSLISSPDFISRHSNQTFDSRKEVLLVKSWPRKESKPRKSVHERALEEVEEYSLHLDNDQFDLFSTAKSPTIKGCKWSKIVGTSNGLICLADYFLRRFVLWNPTIQKYVLLPAFTATIWGYYHDSLNLHGGFGFDHRNNDFKVVNLFSRNHRVVSAWVFSYLTWSWKQITDSTPPPCCVDEAASPVLINGVLHWVARSIVGDYIVLTFDLAREMFGKILLPRSINNNHPFSRSISISTSAAGNSIAVSKKKFLRDEPKWSMWVMKQYGVHESWTNIVTTNELDPINVFDISKNGDIILELEVGRILRYNPLTNVLGGVTALGALHGIVFIGYHTESLRLLDKGEEVDYSN